LAATVEVPQDRFDDDTPPRGESGLDRFFGITRSGSTVRTEVVAGVTLFLAMCYIIFLNPAILSSVKDSAGHSLAFGQVVTVTALVAGVMTLLMGIIGKAPLGLAAGLGINAFVAFGLVGGPAHLTWPEAMGAVVIEGALMVVLVYVRDIRERVLNAIPMDLKHAIAAGIGLFIGLIGLVNAGLVVKGNGTLVAMAPHIRGWPLVLFLFGLVSTSAFVAAGKRGALLYGILLTTVVATVVNALNGNHVFTDGSAKLPDSLTAPSFHLVGAFSFDFVNVLGLSSALAVVASLALTDFFDNAGTTYGVLGSGGLLNPDGTLPKARSRLGIDAFAAIAGGAASASSNTTYIESAAGVEAGGRTGLTAVVVGVLFLACILLAPIAGIVPSVATAPVLVIVAYYMVRKVAEINLADPRIGIPALVTMIVMPFTYSITNGVGAGLVLYTLLSVLTGKAREVHPALYIVSAVFCWYFWHGVV
jgi:AGZA family xanthine/uracil permease-like MFS transporter